MAHRADGHAVLLALAVAVAVALAVAVAVAVAARNGAMRLGCVLGEQPIELRLGKL